ncbi:hypothetical protein ES332_D09G161900v1 [Gossypium tomentosum]|uniref:Uncharacterized protein n=1 Tax=Gossypium tomentosum TaxID=34277 RepID=A0A5D2JHV4_GOSTO|nr:hypothetical protein ES332_D09G161900v1 [Gossypium tomentosum]
MLHTLYWSVTSQKSDFSLLSFQNFLLISLFSYRQEILNGNVGGGFRGIQITFDFFQIWRASGITNELQLYCTATNALVFVALIFLPVRIKRCKSILR